MLLVLLLLLPLAYLSGSAGRKKAADKTALVKHMLSKKHAVHQGLAESTNVQCQSRCGECSKLCRRQAHE